VRTVCLMDRKRHDGPCVNVNRRLTSTLSLGNTRHPHAFFLLYSCSLDAESEYHIDKGTRVGTE
jgi:hypothetical protein